MSIVIWFMLSALAVLSLMAIKKYLEVQICNLNPDMTGKVVIITGGDNSIGYHTALRLAQLGAHVILACKHMDLAKNTQNKIIKLTQNHKIESLALDLGDTTSIREFVKQFKSKHQRIDILINNYNLMEGRRRLTNDGFEMVFGVNYLGHFMLTLLLKDYLINSAPSRVINISSRASLVGKINWNDLMLQEGWSAAKAYSQSKLANVIFSYQFNRRFEDEGVKSVSVHPGIVSTEVLRYMKEKPLTFILGILTRPFVYFLFNSPERGAQTSLKCALLSHEDLVGGRYYSNCKVAKMAAGGRNEQNRINLWERSLEVLNMEDA